MPRRTNPHEARDSCLNRGAHTPSPAGYLQWDAWAEKMAETHDQHPCPGCGYWMIWTKRKDSTA